MSGINSIWGMILSIGGLIASAVIGALLHVSQDTEFMLAKMREVSTSAPEDADETYLNAFAVALFQALHKVSYDDAQTVSGFWNVAWNMLVQMPEKVTLAQALADFQRGFGKYAPTAAAQLTEAVILKASRLMLAAFMLHGQPESEEMIQAMITTLFDAAKDDEGIVYDEVIFRAEAKAWVAQASPEELAEIGDELVATIRTWEEPNTESGETA